MSDDNPHQSNGSKSNGSKSNGSKRKSLLSRIAQVFNPEPKNKNDLVDVLTDAQSRELINPETKQMIEGVLEVSEMRVRDFMIPRSQMVTFD